MMMNECIDMFLMDQKLSGNTEKTIKNYKQFLYQFSEFLNNMSVDKLSIEDINRYHLSLNNRNVTGTTIRTYLRHIKVFLKFLYKKGFAKTNVAEFLIMPKARKTQIDVLNDDEVKVMLAECDQKTVLGSRNYAMLMLMVDSGLRKGEVEGLKTDWINFDQGYIKVLGKGEKERIVPMGMRCKRAMLDYLYRRRTKELDGEYFFLTKTGTPLTEETIKNLMSDLRIKTGIVRLKAHLLRHTYATNFLLNRMGDIYELKMLLGHEDIQTTQIYMNIASYLQVMKKQGGKSYADQMK